MKRLQVFLSLFFTSLMSLAQPNSPSNLIAYKGPRHVQLQWNIVSGTGITYKIYRGTQPGNKVLIQSGVQGNSVLIPVPNLYTPYYFSVSAQNASGESAQSNEVIESANRIYYISNSGASNGGGSENKPFSVVSNAVNAAQNGDTLLFLPGTYNQRILLGVKNLSLLSNYAFNSNPQSIQQTVFESNLINAPSSFISSSHTGKIHIAGFTFRNIPSIVISVNALSLKNCRFESCAKSSYTNLTLIQISNGADVIENKFIDNGASVGGGIIEFSSPFVISDINIVANEFIQNRSYNTLISFHHYSGMGRQNVMIKDNLFRNNVSTIGDAAIVLAWHKGPDNNKAIIQNNVIVQNQSGGIRTISKGQDSVIITHNTISNNSLYAISASHNAATPFFLLSNNILHRNPINNGNGHVFIYKSNNVSGMATANISSNIIGFTNSVSPESGITRSGLFSVVTNAPNYSFYPQFVDSSNGNFRLQNTSLALNAASINNWTPNTDFTGNARPLPLGTLPDIGAHELASMPIVSGLLASGGPRKISLQWGAITGTGLMYRVYRSSVGSGRTKIMDSLITNFAVDSNVSLYENYTYDVEVFNATGVLYTTNESSARASRIWYVGNMGSNTNVGSEANPYLSYDYVIPRAINEDTIILLPGTYKERMILTNRSLVISSKFLLTREAAYKENTVIDGSILLDTLPLIDDILSASSSCLLYGFKVKNSYKTAVNLKKGLLRHMIFDNNYIGSVVPVSHGLYLQNPIGVDSCLFRNQQNKEVLYLLRIQNFSPTNNGFFRDNILEGNHTANKLLAIDGSSNVSFFVSRNIFRNNQGYYGSGVEAIWYYNVHPSSAMKLFIDNNLIIRNDSIRGMQIEGGVNDTIYIANNTITRNGLGVRITANSGKQTYLINNIIQRNGLFVNNGNIFIGGNIFPIQQRVTFLHNIIGHLPTPFALAGIDNINRVDTAGSLNNVGAEVSFVDSAQSDYRLADGSVGLGSGFTASYLPNYDLLGSARPNPTGSNPDLGCYESFNLNPSNLIATVGPSVIQLNWNGVAGVGVLYRVFRSVEGANFTQLISGLTSNSYIDNTAQPNIAYAYSVQAYTTNGSSNLTNVVNAQLRRIWYVSNTGSNSNSGAINSPLLTIANAIFRSVNGDTIVLEPGTYAERINLTGKSVVVGSRYVLTHDTSFISNTIIDGNSVVNSGVLVFDGYTAVQGVRALVGLTLTRSKTSLFDLNEVILRRLRITNNGLSAGNHTLMLLHNSCMFDSSDIINNVSPNIHLLFVHDGDDISKEHVVYVRNNKFLNNYSGIGGLNFTGNLGKITRYFENNIVSRLSGSWYHGGLAFGNSNSSLGQKMFIQNNLFVKNSRQTIAVDEMKALDSIFFINNVITENASGIRMSALTPNYSLFVNNILINGDSLSNNANFWITGAPSFPITRAVFKSNVIGFRSGSPFPWIPNYDYLDILDSSHNLGASFEFADTTYGKFDYSLLHTSKLIGAGFNHVSLLPYDFNGNPKPSPGVLPCDIGAFEQTAAYPTPVIIGSESGDEKITLTWKSNVQNSQTKFRIFRSNQAFTQATEATLVSDIIPITSFEYTDNQGLQNLQTYYYRIQAGDDNGNWSELSNLHMAVPRVPPAAPSNFAVYKGPRRIRLNWDTVTGNTIRYKVYRGSSRTQLSLYKDSVQATSFLDTLVQPFVTYYYAVNAFDVYNTKSALSDTLSMFANRIWYIDTGGLASNSGLEDACFKSISQAYLLAQNRDTIVLNPGTYTQQLTLNTKRVFLTSRYLFDKNPAIIDATILNGSAGLGNTTLISDLNYSLQEDSTDLHCFYGFTITGSKGSVMELVNAMVRKMKFEDNLKNSPTGVSSYCAFSGYSIIDSCIFLNNNTQRPYYFLNIGSGKNSWIRNNVFENNKYTASLIYLYHPYIDANRYIDANKIINNEGISIQSVIAYYSTNTTIDSKLFITNNLIAKNAGRPLDIYSSQKDSVFIDHNTFVDNREQILFHCENGKWTSFTNNMVAYNGTGSYDQFLVYGAPQTPRRPLKLYGNFFGNEKVSNPLQFINNIHYFDTSGSSNNHSGIPELMDTASGDYRLSNFSLAIAAADNSKLISSADIVGQTRPFPAGSAADIGCYETRSKYIAPRIIASEAGNQRMEIFWAKSPSVGITKYRVFRSNQPITDTSSNLIIAAQLTVSDTMYLDLAGLQNLTTYYYRVQAGDDNGFWSGLSNEWQAIPRIPPTVPAVFVGAGGPRRIKLNWHASLGNIYRYKVYRGTQANQLSLYRDSVEDVRFIDSTVTPYVNYYYAIRPFDQWNTKGGFSDTLVQTANRVWYVDTAGSNSYFGFEDSSYRTISLPYYLAEAGDTIVLKQGIYKEQLELLAKRLVIGSRYLLDPNPNYITTTLLDGSNGLGTSTFITDFSNGHNSGSKDMHVLVGLTLTKSRGRLLELSNVILRKLIIEDNITVSGTHNSLLFVGGIVSIDSCIIRNNNRFRPTQLILSSTGYDVNNTFVFRHNEVYGNIFQSGLLRLDNSTVSYTRFIENNKIYNNTGLGTNYIINYSLAGSSVASKAYVRNNLIARNTSSGMALSMGNSDTVYVSGNTITQNTSGALIFASTGNFTHMFNNIFSHNSTNNSNQILVGGSPKTPRHKLLLQQNMVGNVLSANPLQSITNISFFDTVGSVNNVSGPAYFLDTAALNYKLENYSNAIGKGLLHAQGLGYDLENAVRPLPANTLPDLGCYESIYGTNAPRLTTINADSARVRLTWTVNANGIQKYVIYRGIVAGAETKIDEVAANILVYNDYTVNPQTHYFYRLKAVSLTHDTSGFSNELSARPLAPVVLVTPQDSNVNTPRSIRLHWDKNEHAVNYRLQISRNPNFTSLILKDTTTADTSYLVQNLSFNTNYYWRVRAINSSGFGNWSNRFVWQTIQKQPAISQISTEHERATLSWANPLDTTVVKYYIYKTNLTTSLVTIDSVEKGVYTYTDSSLMNQTIFSFQISSVNLWNVKSEKSIERKAIALAAPSLASPANAIISPSRTPLFTWNKNEFATEYQLQLSLENNFTSLSIDTINPDTFFQASEVLAPNSYYYWRVKSIDSLGFSLYSQTYGFQTELSVPNFLSITSGNKRLSLHWMDTGSANVSKYYIYKGSSSTTLSLYDSILGGNFRYIDTIVSNGNTYFYRISAVSQQGLNSPPSTIRSGIPYELLQQVEAKKGPRSVFLSWQPPTQSIDFYQVFRSTDNAEFTLLKDSFAFTSYLDQTAQPGVNYYYTLRTIDLVGNASEWSDTVWALPNRIWHVDTAGNNAEYAGEFAPLKTIGSAIGKASQGDTLLIRKGTYFEALQLNGKELTLASTFLFSRNIDDRDSTFIDGTGLGVLPLINDALNKSVHIIGLHFTNAPQMVFQSSATGLNQIKIESCKFSKSGNSAINGLLSIKNGEISKCVFENCEANKFIIAGDYTANAKLTLNQNVFRFNTANVALIDAQKAILSNSLFYRNVANIIKYAEDANSTDTVLLAFHNTIANNKGLAIAAGGSATSIFDNNLVSGNLVGLNFIATNQFAKITFRNNLIQGFSAVIVPTTFTVVKENNIDSGAYFKDTVNNDYVLGTYSLAIGAANALYGNSPDLFGSARTNMPGMVNDMGAIESEYSVQAPYITSIVSGSGRIQLNWVVNANSLKRLIIYRGTSENTLMAIDTINATDISYLDLNVLPEKYYYYQVKAEDLADRVSGFSNLVFARWLSVANLVYPANNSFYVNRKTELFWSKNPFALAYQVQVSSEVDFGTLVLNNVVLDTFILETDLQANRSYFWRVKQLDQTGESNWSAPYIFETDFDSVYFDSVVSGNHVNTLYWNFPTIVNMKGYIVQRESNSSFLNPVNIDTVSVSIFTYRDENLTNNQTYYYRLVALNSSNVSASPSRILSGVPFNTKPIANKLSDVYLPNQGRKIYNNYVFTSNGSTDSDGKIDSTVWFVNGRRITSSTDLSYDYRQGSSLVVLKVYDDDMGMDSSYAYVHVSTFEVVLGSSISGGISARNENMIYVADERPSGAKMFQLDSLGVERFALGVDFSIRTTPSIGHDTSVFITNGNGLNAFNKLGSSLFPRKDLGGLVLVTPTIDSTLQRIYLGIESNSNFFALNASNSSQDWVYQCKAPIQSSAVLTSDRKLIFPDIAGNLYGFDVSTSSSQGSPAAPKWQYQILDSVNTSPAIDNSGKIFVGTRSGKLKKLSFEPNGTVIEIWSQNLGSAVSNSPVIDADGFVYIGCENGSFLKLNPTTGAIVWIYNTGAAIKSTPAISNYGKIYVANQAGLLTVIDTNKNEFWFYKDTTAINANILHIKGTTYIGTMGGKVIAFWDKDLPFNRKKAEPEKEPMWGTFQGNTQRTGAKSIDTTTSVGISKIIDTYDANLSLYPNPATNEFYIKLVKGEVKDIRIINSIGVEVLSQTGIDNNDVINISQLPSGVYICLVRTNTGTYQRKLIVQK